MAKRKRKGKSPAKPLTASEMARKRWRGVSPEERSRLATAAIRARWARRDALRALPKTGS